MTVVSLFCFLVGDVDPGLCREKKDAPSKPPSSVSDMTAQHTHTLSLARTQTQLFSWRALLASVCCSLCFCCCCWCVCMCVCVCVCVCVAVQSREDSSAEQSKPWLAFSLFVCDCGCMRMWFRTLEPIIEKFPASWDKPTAGEFIKRTEIRKEV